jgi:hypothetical protein
MATNREIEAYKEKLKILPQRLGDGAHFNSDHISSLIEQQYEELTVAKKQIIEYDARENINQQQWNSLLNVLKK